MSRATGYARVRALVDDPSVVGVDPALLHAVSEASHPWRDRAACVGLPESMFFVGERELPTKALAVCRTCPVRTECLLLAMCDDPSVHGVFGGATPKERARLRHRIQRRLGLRKQDTFSQADLVPGDLPDWGRWDARRRRLAFDARSIPAKRYQGQKRATTDT